jgi:hypothetical protein
MEEVNAQKNEENEKIDLCVTSGKYFRIVPFSCELK